MTVQINVIETSQDGKRPGSIVTIEAEKFDVADPESFKFIQGVLGETGLENVLISPPEFTRFEFQIPGNFPHTSEDGEMFGYTIRFMDTSGIYEMSSPGPVTVVNPDTGGKAAEMTLATPNRIAITDLRDEFITVKGTNLDDADAFFFQRVSGPGGKSRVAAMTALHTSTMVKMKFSPPAILAMKPESRFRVEAMSKIKQTIISCPTIINITTPDDG